MKKLTDVLVKAVELDARLTGTPEKKEQVKRLQQWGMGLFRIVVMGELKKGKSSFINALLGTENLVPVSSDVATSTIYKIRYGEQITYRVFFTQASGKQEVRITADELYSYGTEDGNPGNEKQVEFIEVCCPSPILKSGVILIDTPGLGALFSEHRKITYQYVPKADAVFFVTDSVESPIGKLETEYLHDISAVTRHIYFIQTKAFAVDKEAREARKINNLNILAACLQRKIEQIPYFIVDSALRYEAEKYQDSEDLLASGYPSLLSYVNKVLLPSQRKILKEQALLQAEPVLQHLQLLEKEKAELLAADTEQKQKEIQDGLLLRQSELETWETQRKGDVLRTLAHDLEIIQQDALQQIAACRPCGEVQMEFENMIMEAETREALHEVLSNIQERLPYYASRCAQNTAQKMESETEKMLRRLQLPLLKTAELNPKVNQISNVNSLSLSRVAAELEKGTDFFQGTRTALYGGMAGVGIASVVGGIVGSVIPVVGTIIGSGVGTLIAGLWGAYKADEYQEAQTLKANKSQAISAVASALTSAYNKMQDSIRNSFIEIRTAAQNAVAEALQRHGADLKEQLDAVRNRAKASAETLRKMKQEHTALKLALDEIEREVTAAKERI